MEKDLDIGLPERLKAQAAESTTHMRMMIMLGMEKPVEFKPCAYCGELRHPEHLNKHGDCVCCEC